MPIIGNGDDVIGFADGFSVMLGLAGVVYFATRWANDNGEKRREIARGYEFEARRKGWRLDPDGAFRHPDEDDTYWFLGDWQKLCDEEGIYPPARSKR